MARYRRTVLATAAVLLLLMLGAAPAVAGKPAAKPPALPPTCASITTVPKAGNFNLECRWTPQQAGALGSIQVDVEKGTLTYLLISVRDYAPGDYCSLTPYPEDSGSNDWVTWQGSYGTGSTLEAVFDMVSETSSYWYVDPAHPERTGYDWCGTAYADQDTPLWVRITGRTDRGAVRITLNPPQA